ncbi:uncharacterized protein F4807DRAFT_439888 [Annulohypoxylon truncatum]|uniref:uncharacterized protein n=1 Tax=Annulohypoxylon truncatum TaxID=327061 RepID=UPI002007571D|nr:uncharacterized protein F4807DRAFT_439888 [Annulohypoxylon truncatum]KAI1206115.1 hypothetical protein F4807DRAFT_439888 [Annulohypoxylon truncatum]
MEPVEVPSVSITKSLGAIIFLNIVAGCFVASRIAASCSRGNRSLSIDDFLSLVALILLSSYSAVTYTFELPTGSQVENMPITTIDYVLRQTIILTTVAAFTMYFSKTPLLVLYVRIFGVKKWLRMMSYTTLALSLMLFLTTTAVVGATCSRKVSASDYMPPLEQCLETTISVGVANGSTAVLTDIIVIILPLPAIAGLNLPFHKKVGIAIIFLTGIFATSASAISLYYKSMSFTGHSTTLMVTLFCTIIECSLAIIVGCVPGVRACWSAYEMSALHKKVKSMFARSRSVKSSENYGVDDES